MTARKRRADGSTLRWLSGTGVVVLLGCLVSTEARAWETHVPSTVPGGGDEARAVAIDGARNVVAVGVTQNPANVAAPSRDFTVAKLSGSNGTQLWRTLIDEPLSRMAKTGRSR